MMNRREFLSQVGLGAAGLVLFNRFYQPSIDIETLETICNVELSGASDQRLPLRWIGLLHGRQGLDLAASGGISSGQDMVKMLMVGAQVTQVVGALLRHGPGHLQRMQGELCQWLEEHGYGSLDALRGCLSQALGLWVPWPWPADPNPDSLALDPPYSGRPLRPPGGAR